MGGGAIRPADARTVIETERLRLEPLRSSDADEMFPVLDDPALHTFTGGSPLSREALEERYERLELGRSVDGAEVWGNWIVRVREGEHAVGFVQATLRGSDAELAWVIGTHWQGRGYASESATALADWLRASGIRALTAHIHPEHAASARVARRVGLLPAGEVDDEGELIWRSPD
jgi:RimJ/RimL family protein N-acetyltransferase